MKPLLRMFWLITLLIFASGCSGYRVVGFSLPEVAAEFDAEEPYTGRLQPGDKLLVNLVNGTQERGVLKDLSSDSIVLAAPKDSSITLCLPAAQIQSIEKNEADGGKTAVLVLGAIGALALMTFAEQSEDNNPSVWEGCIGCP